MSFYNLENADVFVLWTSGRLFRVTARFGRFFALLRFGLKWETAANQGKLKLEFEHTIVQAITSSSSELSLADTAGSSFDFLDIILPLNKQLTHSMRLNCNKRAKELGNLPNSVPFPKWKFPAFFFSPLHHREPINTRKYSTPSSSL